jgi:VirE N-terminal domain
MEYSTPQATVSAPSLAAVRIQRFDDLYDSTPSAELPLGYMLSLIVDGTYAATIARARDIYTTHGEEAYRREKNRLPQVTFAGTFAPTRAKDHLIQASGICHGDIDHLADLEATKRRLAADPCVVYCFTSPRGDGLKYGVHIAPVATDAVYKHVWGSLATAHHAAYGVTWDPSGKDICRLGFVSWDPEAYINLDAQVYEVPPEMITPTPPRPRPRTHGGSGLPPRHEGGHGPRALRIAAQMIRESVPGQQHFARCRAAYLLGGYVAGGLVTEAEALDALEPAVEATATNTRKAMKDITDGLAAGQTQPITTEDREEDWRRWQEAHPARAPFAPLKTHLSRGLSPALRSTL